MALYDPAPKIDAAPAEDFTVAEFLAWARTKPADRVYNYWSTANCAASQFVRAKSLGDSDWDKLHLGAAGLAIISEPWTFGALVKRLEALS